MPRFLVIGDTHGDAKALNSIVKWAKTNDCDRIIQAGDFGVGFSTNHHGEDAWLRAVETVAAKSKIPWTFIDGNHDDHSFLWLIFGEDFPGIHPAYPNLTYAPRGSVWTPEGTQTAIGFCGGGVSIDKYWRLNNQPWSYWPTETLRYSDGERLIAAWSEAKPPIVITHDAPDFFPAVKHYRDGGGFPPELLEESDKHRRVLTRLLEAVEYSPQLWIHGHYHHDYLATVHDIDVVGLYYTNPRLLQSNKSGIYCVIDIDADGGFALETPVHADAKVKKESA